MSPARSRHSSRCSGVISAPTGSGPASWSSPSREAYRFATELVRSTSTASTSCSNARHTSRLASPALARAGTRPRARRGPRGRAVQRRGRSTCAAATRAGCSAPASTQPTLRSPSSTSRRRSPTPRRLRARPLQRARAPHGDARALCARPAARGARPLPRASACGSTRSSGSSRRAETRALEVGDHPAGGRPLAAASTDPARRAPRPAAAPVRLLGRTAELETLTRRSPARRSTGRSRSSRSRERPGSARRACSTSCSASLDGVRIGRASCSELERHLPYVPLAAALREALAGVELDAGAAAGARRRSSPSSPRRAEARSSTRSRCSRPSSRSSPSTRRSCCCSTTSNGPTPDARRARAICAAAARPRRGDRDHGADAEAPARPPASPALTPDVVVRLEPLSPSELAPLGMPELHESTGGNPRFVAEALANGPPAARRGRSPRRCSPSAGPRATWATASSSPPPCSSSRSSPSRSQISSAPTRPNSSRSSSASANGESCASTGSASASATTSSARCCSEASHPPANACCSSGSTHRSSTIAPVSQAG